MNEKINGWFAASKPQDVSIINFDNTTLKAEVDSGTKKLLVTSGGLDELKKMRLSASTTCTSSRNAENRSRYIHLTVSTTPAGNVNLGVLKIRDRRYTEVKTSRVFKGVDLPFPLCFQCIPYRPKSQEIPQADAAHAGSGEDAENQVEVANGDLLTEEDEEANGNSQQKSFEAIAAEQLLLCVVSKALSDARDQCKERLECAQLDQQTFLCSPGDEDCSSPQVDKEAVDAAMRDERILITFDGERHQIDAVDKFIKENKFQNLCREVLYAKFPAACSFIFQPCDVSDSFKALKVR